MIFQCNKLSTAILLAIYLAGCGGGGGGGAVIEAPQAGTPTSSTPTSSTPTSSTPTSSTPTSSTPTSGTPTTGTPTTGTPTTGTPLPSNPQTTGTALLQSVRIYSLTPGSTEAIKKLDTSRRLVAVGDDPDVLFYTTSSTYSGTDPVRIEFNRVNGTGVFRSNGATAERISVPPTVNNPAEEDNGSYAIAVSKSGQHMAYTIDSLKWKNATCGIFCSSTNTYFQSLTPPTAAIPVAVPSGTPTFNQYTSGEGGINVLGTNSEVTAISNDGQYVFGRISRVLAASNASGSCTRLAPAVFNRSTNTIQNIVIPEWENVQRVATFCLNPSLINVRWIDPSAFIFSFELFYISNTAGATSVGSSGFEAIYRYDINTTSLTRIDKNSLNQTVTPQPRMENQVCAISSDGTRSIRKMKRKDWLGTASTTDFNNVLVMSDLNTAQATTVDNGSSGFDHACGSDAAARYLYRIGNTINGGLKEGAGFYDTISGKFYKLNDGLRFTDGAGFNTIVFDSNFTTIWGTKATTSPSGSKILTLYVRAGHGIPPRSGDSSSYYAWYQLKIELRD